MSKLKKIGGLLFKSTKSGLHYAGVAGKKTYHAGKYLHGSYKSYKAGEVSRLQEKREKERIKADIRQYRQRYKPQSSFLKKAESFFSPSKKRRR
jgi:hypothetical protein